MKPKFTPLETQLLVALRDLHEQIRSHIKFDVKRHFSLMVADAQASKVIRNAELNHEQSS